LEENKLAPGKHFQNVPELADFNLESFWLLTFRFKAHSKLQETLSLAGSWLCSHGFAWKKEQMISGLFLLLFSFLRKL